MGRKHEGLLMEMFPRQKGVGIDYGNIKFKESTNGFHKFSVYPKDMLAEYFLFYDQETEFFYLSRVSHLPKIQRKRSFRTILKSKNVISGKLRICGLYKLK